MKVLVFAGLSLYIFFSCSLSIAEDSFPIRSNILFILDVNLDDQDVIASITQLLDGISLMKYRISLAASNGVSQDLFHYQSRRCLINKLKKKTKTHHLLLHTIKNSGEKFFINFKSANKILVTITQKPLSREVQNLLSRYFRRHKTHSIYGIILKNKGRFVVEDQISFDIGGSYEVTKLLRDQSHAKVIHHIKTFDSVLKELHFYEDDLKTCNPSKELVYDECKRECQCIDGKLTNCYRVRRQFSTLPLEERKYYINGYKELASGKDFEHRYYEYMMIHPKNFKKLHAAPQLLTWHRRFVYETENLLRLLDCRLTIPYWNFPLFENATYTSTPTHHFWDDVGGLGSTKTNINNGYCLETGEFQWQKWKTMKVPDWYLIEFIYSVCYDRFFSEKIKDPTEGDKCVMILRETFKQNCVLRNPGCFEVLPTYKRIYDVLQSYTADRFEHFEEIFRNEWHIVMHDCMGGNMGTGVSNYSPEFWPYHSMIDAIWTYWQDKGRGNKEVLMHDNKTMLIGFNELRSLHQDNDNVGGCGVKIKYTNIFPHIP